MFFEYMILVRMFISNNQGQAYTIMQVYSQEEVADIGGTATAPSPPLAISSSCSQLFPTSWSIVLLAAMPTFFTLCLWSWDQQSQVITIMNEDDHQ